MITNTIIAGQVCHTLIVLEGVTAIAFGAEAIRAGETGKWVWRNTIQIFIKDEPLHTGLAHELAGTTQAGLIADGAGTSIIVIALGTLA